MAKKKVVAPAAKKNVKKDREVLVVASKVKDYIKSKGGNTRILVSGDFTVALSEAVYGLIDKAVARAQENKRSTVQPKDV